MFHKFLFDASYEAKSEVTPVYVQPCYKSRRKRKLKLKITYP